MSHTDDPKLLNRLRRAHGHLATIIKMVEEGRDALDIAQQMKAVVSALDAAKTLLVADHIEHHLQVVVGPLSEATRKELARLRQLAKYL